MVITMLMAQPLFRWYIVISKAFILTAHFIFPDRYAEGYGVSRAGVIYAEENNFSLIIALDLGIKADDMVMLANHKGH